MGHVLRLQGHDTLKIAPNFKINPSQSIRTKKYDQLQEIRKYCIPLKKSPWDASKQPKCPGVKYNVIDFMKLASSWDRGSRTIREKILEEFIRSCKYKTAPQLELELSNGASLFLTRITSWLRLTFLLNYNISLQIEAITIFTSSSGGSQFLSEFIEIGGVLTLIEIITQPQIKERDKATALRALTFICAAGRKYKELICECKGIHATIECLSSCKLEISQDYARHLLQELGAGNPKFLMQVYRALLSLLTSSNSILAQLSAGQALRGILHNVTNIHTSIVDATVAMLKSPHFQLQQEGFEILRALIGRPVLQDVIIASLNETLQIVPEDSEEETNNNKKSNKNKTSKESSDQQAQHHVALYMQQCYAIRLLGMMAALSPELVGKIVHAGVVLGTLLMISNIKHPESQAYASDFLFFLTQKSASVVELIKEHLGNTFYEFFSSKPDTFYKEFTKDQVRYLKRNALRLRRTTRTASRREEEMPMLPTISNSASTSIDVFSSLTSRSNDSLNPSGSQPPKSSELTKKEGNAIEESSSEFLNSSGNSTTLPAKQNVSTHLFPQPIKPNSGDEKENSNTTENLMYLPLVTLVPKGLLSSSNVQPKERNEEGIEEYQATLKKLQQTPIGPMKQTEIPFPSIEGILAYKDRNFERELRERFDIGEHDVQSLVGGLPSIEDGEEEDSETNGDETILELPEGNNSDSKDPTSPLEGHKLYKAIMEDLQLETESKKLKH